MTRELLHDRTRELFMRAFDAGGPIEDVLFEVVRCDGCETTVNMLAHGCPVGWRTRGDFEDGFFDLCPDCWARKCAGSHSGD